MPPLCLEQNDAVEFIHRQAEVVTPVRSSSWPFGERVVPAVYVGTLELPVFLGEPVPLQHGHLHIGVLRAAVRAAGWLEAHHVTALQRGGAPQALGNVTTLCRSCHIAAHARQLTPAEQAWARLVETI